MAGPVNYRMQHFCSKLSPHGLGTNGQAEGFIDVTPCIFEFKHPNCKVHSRAAGVGNPRPTGRGPATLQMSGQGTSSKLEVGRDVNPL